MPVYHAAMYPVYILHMFKKRTANKIKIIWSVSPGKVDTLHILLSSRNSSQCLTSFDPTNQTPNYFQMIFPIFRTYKKKVESLLMSYTLCCAIFCCSVPNLE